MKRLNSYIIEKLHINKDDAYNGKYIDAIWSWIKDHSFFDREKDDYEIYSLKNNIYIKFPDDFPLKKDITINFLIKDLKTNNIYLKYKDNKNDIYCLEK